MSKLLKHLTDCVIAITSAALRCWNTPQSRFSDAQIYRSIDQSRQLYLASIALDSNEEEQPLLILPTSRRNLDMFANDLHAMEIFSF